MSTNNLLVILGPTASGKTKLAVKIAQLIKGEIISADSRQVYRDMNIGTGKDYLDYVLDGIQIPYHLIDITDAGSKYNLNRFKQDAEAAFLEISNKKSIPILCGGSGLYIQAVLSDLGFTSIPKNEMLRQKLEDKSLDLLQEMFLALPKTAFTLLADIGSQKRCIRAIEISSYLCGHPNFEAETYTEKRPFIIGINPSLDNRRERISARLKQRLQEGLVEEVANLASKGMSPDLFEYYGLEYKFMWRYLQKEISFDQMFILLEIAIQQFAKRQMTYFRKMEKDGIIINWIDGDLPFDKQVEMAMGMIGNKFNKEIV